MHIVPKFTPRIYLIHIDGDYWVFKSLEEAADYIFSKFRHFVDKTVGERHRDRRPCVWAPGGYLETIYPYIVRTELGDVVTLNDLHAHRKSTAIKWYYRWADYNSKTHYRKIPVPSTGRSHKRYHGFRRIHTISERRQTLGHLIDDDCIEYNVKIRAKRNHKNIPNNWDDIPRDCYCKSWKRYRKHQWKEKRK